MEKSIYIVAHWNSYSKEFVYGVQGYPLSSDSEYVLIEEQKVEFNSLADMELRAQTAAALRRKKARVLADAHVEAKEIDETIQELLAIEDKSNG